MHVHCMDADREPEVNELKRATIKRHRDRRDKCGERAEVNEREARGGALAMVIGMDVLAAICLQLVIAVSDPSCWSRSVRRQGRRSVGLACRP